MTHKRAYIGLFEQVKTLLNDKMKASKEGIELKVESDISITLSYEELKPMMREVWKEKLVE